MWKEIQIIIAVICGMAIAHVIEEKYEEKSKLSFPGRAKLLFKTNKLAKLALISDKYIEKYPNYYVSYYYKMLIAVQKKEYKKAMLYLEKVYELNPRAYERFGPYMKFLKERKAKIPTQRLEP